QRRCRSNWIIKCSSAHLQGSSSLIVFTVDTESKWIYSGQWARFELARKCCPAWSRWTDSGPMVDSFSSSKPLNPRFRVGLPVDEGKVAMGLDGKSPPPRSC